MGRVARAVQAVNSPLKMRLAPGKSFGLGLAEGFFVEGFGGAISGIRSTVDSLIDALQAWTNWLLKTLRLLRHDISAQNAEDVVRQYEATIKMAIEIGIQYGPLAATLFNDLAKLQMYYLYGIGDGEMTPETRDLGCLRSRPSLTLAKPLNNAISAMEAITTSAGFNANRSRFESPVDSG